MTIILYIAIYKNSASETDCTFLGEILAHHACVPLYYNCPSLDSVTSVSLIEAEQVSIILKNSTCRLDFL